MSSNEGGEAVDLSWIGTPEAVEKNATECLTDRMGEWCVGFVVSYDDRTRRVKLFVDDDRDDGTGWEFDDVPARTLLPLPPDDSETGDAPLQDDPARRFVMAGLEAEDPEQAITCFVETLALDPQHWFAAESCALRYRELENWQSAAAYFRKALAVPAAARYPGLHFELAWCMGKLKRWQAEIDAYQACLALDADWPNARNNLGYSLMRIGNYPEAVKVLEEALRRGNDGKFPLRNLPTALLKLGRKKEAVGWLQKDLRGHSLTKRAASLLAKLGAPSQQPQHEGPPTEEEEAECIATPPNWAASHNEAKKDAAFHKERHLELELVASLERAQPIFDRRLQLYLSADGRSGQQFAMPGFGIIDLLTLDLDTKGLVVIELKRGSAGDEVVEQVLRYIDGVRKTVANPDQSVKGIVVVREASGSLRSAAVAAGVEVRTYGVSYQLA